jgi:hypothetical protein
MSRLEHYYNELEGNLFIDNEDGWAGDSSEFLYFVSLITATHI